jgi:O-antigen ligase
MAPGGRTDVFPSDRYLWLSGAITLRAAFSLGIAVMLLTAWKKPELVPFIPLLLLTGAAGWTLFRHPLANLAVVLSAFVLIADFEAGIQVSEVLYGVYFLGFLAHWFFTRLLLGGGRVFERLEETVLFAFLILAVLTVPLTILFNGSLGGVASELLSLSMFGFYWPVKEAVARNRRGLEVMIGVILVVGTFVMIRNFINYREIIASASYAWQVTRGRAVTNEGLLMVPAIFCISFYIYARRRAVRWIAALGFVLFFAGLILTQSRGYWLAFLFGAGILFLVVPWKSKIRLVTTVIFAGLAALAIGMYFFGDFLILILSGLTERFLSILTAIVNDDSLRNRFNETAAVWEFIKLNPILGYGMGVSYRFYDFTVFISPTRTFIHNGYVSMWFKFGLWGLGMVLVFFGSIIRRAYSAFRHAGSNTTVSAASLAVVGSFAAFSLSAITSNPFYVNDTMFIFGVLTGIAGGLYSRSANNLQTDPDTA